MRAAILVFSALLPGCASEAIIAPIKQEPRSGLDSVLIEIANRYHMPAITGAVIWPDSIHVAAFGVRHAGESAVVTTHDRFHIGSNTKAMTALVTAVLVERGQLSWETAAAQVFPEAADSMHALLRNITIAQLLTHRAGIAPYNQSSDFEELNRYKGDPVKQRRDLVSRLLSRAPNSPVGQFNYSNAGYGLAAAMIERVTGQSWEQLIGTLLFQPMQMNAQFGWPAEQDGAQPWGHWTSGGGFKPQNPHRSYHIPAVIAPAGDVNLSIEDYARFLQLNLRGLLGRDSIVSAATWQRLHSPIGEYAYGWAVVPLGGVRTSAHDGSGGSFYATALIQRDRGIAVAVMTNGYVKDVARALSEAAQRLLVQGASAVSPVEAPQRVSLYRSARGS